MPNYADGSLNIDIRDSKNSPCRFCINNLTENIYEIKYVPNEIGLYSIAIRYNDKELPGSPFISQIVNPNKVKILGENEYFLNAKIFDFELNEEKFFCFDTSDAGPGTSYPILLPQNWTIFLITKITFYI